MFLPDRAVPEELLTEAIALAMRAPSNSTVQPWQVYLATGARRDKLATAPSAEARSNPPTTLGLPDTLAESRRERAHWSTDRWASPATTPKRRWNAQLRNFEFFYAPVAGIVCMHRDLDMADALGVGMFPRRHLALRERGVDSCGCRSTTSTPRSSGNTLVF